MQIMFLANARVAIAIIALGSFAHAQTFIANYAAQENVDAELDDALQLSLQDVIESNNCVDFNSGLGDLSDYDTIINQRPSYTDSTSDEFFEYEKYYGTKDFYKIWIDKLISSRPNGDGTQGSGDISGIPELRQFDPDFRESFAPGPDGNTACDECSVEDGESSCCGYAQSLRIVTAYIGTSIESYQLMQKAIDKVTSGCIFSKNGCTEARQAWDAAVAIYTGLEEGSDGNNEGDCSANDFTDYGVSGYGLADKMCKRFFTCGEGRSCNSIEPALINTKIIGFYAAGSVATNNGVVYEMQRYKKLIAAKMAVPLIQGMFEAAYKRSTKAGSLASTCDYDRATAASFAFGALPKINACSKTGAKRIAGKLQLRAGNKKPLTKKDFDDSIRLAAECNYRCLGITCQEIGALKTPGAGSYGNSCNDDFEGNGSDLSGIYKCKKWKGQRKQKCKLFTGNPGIDNRDDDDYFVKESSPRVPLLLDFNNENCNTYNSTDKSGRKCGLCEGDCNVDADCADGLVCFIRDSCSNSYNVDIPGCTNNPDELVKKDFCVDERLYKCEDNTSFVDVENELRTCDWVAEDLGCRCLSYGDNCRRTCGYCRATEKIPLPECESEPDFCIGPKGTRLRD